MTQPNKPAAPAGALRTATTMAHIIDREIGMAALLDAAKAALVWYDNTAHSERVTPEWRGLMEGAIAKCESGTGSE